MLSLSMIVRDEAARLERCLNSVAGFVDEMVVVDTGSRDDTVAVARRCGAVVHELPWPGDFAPARNQAMQLVQGDWILVLDADETLSDAAREPLLKLMADSGTLLINLLRREQGATQSPFSSVSRLFRNHPALRWSRPYHAMIDDSVMELLSREPHWRIRQCPVPALLHDGYRPDLIARGDKAKRLRTAMEAELEKHPGDPYACSKLGGLEISSGDRERGISLLKQGLSRCPDSDQAVRFELLLHLGMAHAQNDPATGIAFYRQALALSLDPRLTVAARLNMAALMVRMGQPHRAVELNTEVTRIAPDLPLGWYNLGVAHRQQGHLKPAIAAYQRCLQLEPDHAEAHQNLAVALLLSGDIRGARAGFSSAIALLEHQGRPEQADQLRRQAGELVRLAP